MNKRLIGKKFQIKVDTWLISNNKRFPLVPEIPVVELKRKPKRVK